MNKINGNISTTELRDDVFIKYIPLSKYDNRVNKFQQKLFYNITNLNYFSINKVINNLTISDSNIVECHYEIVNEKQWELDLNSVKLIAENMAKIHNYSNKYRNSIDLLHKESLYTDLSEWEKNVKENIANINDLQIRSLIQKNIKPINKKQIKIPLHRDFRKHNILYDGSKYVLIDFDFAAYDFISIEIMAFISDIISEDINYSLNLIKRFFKTYRQHSEIEDIIWEDITTDYLNYLCVNTFPLYLKDSISIENFNELMKQRNETLLKIYKHHKDIQKLI